MMDPMRRKYGKHLTAALAVVPVISEILWIPALMISLGTTTQTNMQTFNLGTLLSIILFYNELPVSDCAPGATMSVVLDLSFSLCVWISAAVAIFYTVLGGLYSVAYTDVIQISLVLAGLVGLEATMMSEMMSFKCTPLTQAVPVPFPVFQWLCIPFVLISDNYTDIAETALNNTYQAPWLGQLESKDVGRWIDNFLVLVGWKTYWDLSVMLSPKQCSSDPVDSWTAGLCGFALSCYRPWAIWPFRTSTRGRSPPSPHPQPEPSASWRRESSSLLEFHRRWSEQLQLQQVSQRKCLSNVRRIHLHLGSTLGCVDCAPSMAFGLSFGNKLASCFGSCVSVFKVKSLSAVLPADGSREGKMDKNDDNDKCASELMLYISG